MGDQDQLPACALCGADPLRGRNLCKCSTRGCGMSRNVIRDSDWRRLMDRPRLAPEHVVWLKHIAECSEYGMKAYEDLIQDADPGADLKHVMESVESYRTDVSAIRAALAALGEA